MQNYNKLIDLTFIGASGGFSIRTPRSGLKPNISITGELTSASLATNLDIRVTNLYTDKIMSSFQEVLVTAGYESKQSAVLRGSIINVTTETPGPDKVTLIQCTTSNYDLWLDGTVNLNLPAPVMLKAALAQLTGALGYQTEYIDPSLLLKTSTVPLCVNGTVRTAIDTLKKLFPDVTLSIESNRIYAVPQEGVTLKKVHFLRYLMQAPQFSGSAVSLMAPWEPSVRPGDFIQYSLTGYGTRNLAADKVLKRARVISVQFSFDTVGSQNEMLITGTTGV